MRLVDRTRGGATSIVHDSSRTPLLVAPPLVVVGALTSVIATFAACTSSPPAPETQHIHTRSSEGVVTFEQLRDPNGRPPVADAGQEYLRPRLEEGFTLPSYPEEALAAEAPSTEVVVRMVIADDGSVGSVRPSPLADPPEREWEHLFFDTVKAAVSTWRYDPCQLRELEDGPDRDGDGTPDFVVVVASTPVTVYLDLKFRFEIVEGSGRVTMGGDVG